MPKLVLTYFPAAGRAEVMGEDFNLVVKCAHGQATRLALTIGGIEFEDKRIKGEEFMAMKPSLPYGTLPVLEVDGTTYGQSIAQLRYAGKLAGLYPSDPLAALKVDEIIDAVGDLLNLMMPSMREKDEDKKKEMREALAADGGPLKTHAANLTKQLEANGSTGYAVGDSLTIADVVVAGIARMFGSGVIDYIDGVAFMAGFPLLAKAAEIVNAHPKVAEYYASK